MAVLKGKSKEQFEKWYNDHKDKDGKYFGTVVFEGLSKSMQYGPILEFIREKRGVLIGTYRNASGYLWQMEMEDGGTSLGWCDHNGDCEMSGMYTSYNKAMDHAIELEMNYGGMSKFRGPNTHWSNYGSWLIEQEKKKNHE